MLGQVRQLVPVLALLAVGCAKEPAPAATPSTAAPAPAAPAEAKGPAAASASGDAFELKLDAPTPVSAGGQGELTLQLRAKPGYKINSEYPHAFRPEKDSTVKFEGEKFGLANGAKTACEKKAEDTCSLEAKVPFKADAAGDGRASGIVAFSVCNDEVCLIEKIPLATVVSVR